jgi:hypothetical protein
MSGRCPATCPAGLAGIMILLCSLPSPASASAIVERLLAADGTTIVDAIPKSGPGLGEFAAPLPELESSAAAAFPWVLQSQNGAVYTDLSMASATRGFASAELGQVYRTTDGETWQQVMNIGFPRYWYGVHAFSPTKVFISGFQNQSGEGIGRWTSDGGVTWSGDIVVDPAHWLTINQFADDQHGVATAIGSGLTYVTTNGGATAADWTQVLADPTQGWFAGNFTFMPGNLDVYVTGISFCQSLDAGLSYSRRPSIDPVFDGGVSFPDVTHGWTGGGQISAPVQGWVHRTTDGGATWSGRLMNPPYPIRSLLFLDDQLGFAVGGNYFQGIGGIWSTTDGGVNWVLDVDTGCEMKGIDWARVDPDTVAVWSAGSRSGLGRIYRTKLFFPEGTAGVGAAENVVTPASIRLSAAPNPSDGRMPFRLLVSGMNGADQRDQGAFIDIVDVSGRRIRRLELAPDKPMSQVAVWDGRDDRGRRTATGIYYALLGGNAGGKSIPLVLVK